MKMKGMYMNINFSKLFQKLIPFIYIILITYILNSILFFFLPKDGVSYIKDSSSTLDYKKYDFYSNIKKIEDRSFEQIKDKPLQTLEKYDLKAIYYTAFDKGWITIEEKSRTQSYILAYGEEIDGYVLFKLFKNYVLFKKNNKEYKLEIKEKEISNFDMNQSNQQIEEKENGAVVKREYLNSYISNVEKIWSNISIQELKNGDKIEGFKIENINKDSVFEKLGLKKGDVIKSVNNNVLSSYAEAFKVYNNIENTKYLNIEILRNNEVVELNYEID